MGDESPFSNSPHSSYLEGVQKHLAADPEGALKLPSGDITRELYVQTGAVGVNAGSGGTGGGALLPPLQRSRSLEERRSSMASSLRIPGAFRREFHQRKHGWKMAPAGPLTRNFLEFLTVYGHFAGEDLEDEDYLACDLDVVVGDEESPLMVEGGEDNGTANNTGKSSSLKAFFLLLKAFIGTGVLFLPKAFSNGGLAFSAGMLVLFAALSFYCYYALARTTTITGVSSFVDLGDQLFGPTMKYLILISIVVSQLGFVAAYTIFTAENLGAFLANTTGVKLPVWALVGFEALFLVPMSLIRNLTRLSLAALLANVFILGGLVTIVAYASADLLKNGPEPVQMFNKGSWSLFVGVAIFAFEGIGLIIPVQQSMRHPQNFPLVLAAVIVVCVVLFVGIGSLGYLTYGEKVQTVVIMNLPQTSPAVISIQLFYAMAIMLSVPLQLLPAIRILEARIFRKRLSGKVDPHTKWAKNVSRAAITLLTCLLAWEGSANLDLFVSFVGCFACVPLVYMYPPMLHARVMGEGRFWTKAADWALVFFGGFAALYTTYQLLV